MHPNDDAETESTQESGSSPAEGSETAPSVGTESPGAEGQSEASDQPNDHRMPDPSALVAMAAMHLPTLDLINVLVSVFDAHAWRSMGLVADHTGEVRKDLPSAQISIDCLGFLIGKIETTLEEGEKRDIQRRLMDLRMNYVAKVREG